ncbi:hypothetical protein ACHWQZ_G010531 [Mnemiopsis leidyi]
MVMTNLGHILANSKIAVDWFETDSTDLVNYYFCSHVTSEHTAGLTQDWSCAIYCSEITGKLLRHTCQISESLIKPLQFNTSTVIEDTFTVTMLDSNHSMGSAMFLFEGSFGRILYTGHFRWFPELTYPIANLPIDTVYFDNTHSRKGAKFMSRPECKHYAVNYCRLQISQNKVIYFVLEPIGHEDILSHVAESLGIQVVVSEEKYQVIQCMGLSQYFTTDDQEGKVFWVSKSKFNYKKSVAGILERHAPSAVNFVKISGMRRGQNCVSYEYIKFCNHSCMKEIELFFASLCYKSASPIMTKTNSNKNSLVVSRSPQKKHPDNSNNMSNSVPDKIKMKLKKNRDEQTSFTITSEFEKAPTLSYRVSSGVTTDEEVGYSPDTSVISPCQYPGRTCSTPIPNINDEHLHELAFYHDHSSHDSFLSSEIPYSLSFLARSPERAPYIQPPIPLDWLPSPIKCEPENSPNFNSDLKVKLDDGLCSLGEELSPDVNDECSVDVLAAGQTFFPKVSPKFVFPRNCDMQIMCNSPVYNVNGRVSYQNTASMEKEQNILSGAGLPLENHKSNVSMLYEEMFKEDEVCQGIATDLPDDLSDGIEVLNESPDSVETLYVSDTESDSGDEIEKAGPIGDYLRGQYALNQMFNSTVINIRETFNSSTFDFNLFKQRKKMTEDDLASSRVQLLMPKVTHSPGDQVESNSIIETEEVRQARYFIESKDEYFRQLSEITKKCQAITYKKKPKKIGRSLPVSRALLSDSINLLNNYADVSDPRLRDLAWKLTVDKSVPKNVPILEIEKREIPPEIKHEDQAKLVTPDKHAFPSGVVTIKPIISDSRLSDKTQFSPLIESKKTVCVPRHLTTPKTSKNTKSTPKNSPLVVDDNAKKNKRVRVAPPKRQTSNDDIFDMFFGSTPTSLAVKRVKKRSKEPVSRKKMSTADSGSAKINKSKSLVP